MKYISFYINNFKGIESIRLDLSPSGAGIHTLIGLNESGKTTILEAISALELYNDESHPTRATAGETRPLPTTFIPKHLKSNFSGAIRIEARVEFEGLEYEDLISTMEKDNSCQINRDTIPQAIDIRRDFIFENSDFIELRRSIQIVFEYKLKGKRKFEKVKNDDLLWKYFVEKFNNLVPKILYFPTFLFSIPDSIILNPGNTEVPSNKAYREIISNVARSLENPLDIIKHVVDRLVVKTGLDDEATPLQPIDRDKYEQVEASLNDISAHLTETIFDRWSRIFGGDFSGRQIILRLGTAGSGADIQLTASFALKDQNGTYSISERSLGFRWFFSFLLFTLYRVSAKKPAATLFLLDEPASNLHSAAQIQLAASFINIATGSNQIFYSTHSHYMIDPVWLDQAFIVSNQAVDYGDFKVLSVPKRQINRIEATKYRNFVGKNPDKFTYFQPVLDKLAVVPSRIDNVKPALIVEGKGDYIYLEYAKRVLFKNKKDYSIIPTRGATGMDEIIGLYIGWGVKFLVCLDDDKEGIAAEKRYKIDWAALSENFFTLSRIDPRLKGKSIEGILEIEDIDLIKTHFAILDEPTKSQKQLFFSEKLSKNELVSLSEACVTRLKGLDQIISEMLKL